MGIVYNAKLIPLKTIQFGFLELNVVEIKKLYAE